MTEHTWKIVPLSPGQLLDVNPSDILCDGLYRRCDTYKGGGGYDQFPMIAAKRFGGPPRQYTKQFVVQLFGCNLDCPYCYVTRKGVWGSHVKIATENLGSTFIYSGLRVFHLMGGAPAIQMPYWYEIISYIKEVTKTRHPRIFHSDLMLTERLYNISDLHKISKPHCLYAINIKGLTPKEWLENTRKELDEDLFWQNWRLVQEACVPAYVTFTGVKKHKIEAFWGRANINGIQPERWRKEAFVIDIIDYKASEHVDDVPWGI